MSVQSVLGMILLNCIVILILILILVHNCITILILDTFTKMYHDTDTF